MRRHTHGLVEGGVFDNAFYPGPEYRKRRRFHLRRLSFLASTGLTIALLGTGSAHAACDNHDPATGQTATCDTSAPNPDITRVEAAAGSTNVTVVVLPGAGLDVANINGIFVRDLSEVTNQGNIIVTGDTFDGIRFDNNNTITNGGTITTGGALSEGMFSDGGDNNVILNTGTIITGGADSQGILLFTGSTGNTVTNEGTITTTGDNAVGMEAAGDSNVFTNSGTITTPGPNANGILVTGGNNTVTNAGTGTITTTGATAHGVVGNGSNNTLANSGDINVSGPNAHGINWLGATLGTVTNAGTITVTGAGGLGAFFSSHAAFTNTSTGSVVSQQANGIIANGGGTVDNAGEISGQQVGVVVAANGPTVVTNSGTISGVTAQGVLFQGAFNHSLTNTGTINGTGTAVSMGGGDDTLIMNAGAINGAVDQGDGADTFDISTGNVQQGSGTDDFQITGGEIGSLNQGDGLDTFFMSDGRIVDFFDDGDHAVMTGGRIGRVNMKLDDNFFDMSGGTIDRNLVAGFGNDTIILSNGAIGGNISVSGGTDSVTVTGGSVGGSVLMSFGTDTFTWDGGGVIYGTVDLGGDNDTATLKNLTNANLGDTDAITGGLGADNLTLDNVSIDRVSRLQMWESIAATNDTEMIFAENLVLGDSGTGTGTLSINSTSTLFGGGANSAVTPFTAGQLATVINAGRIDLTNGSDSLADTFTIAGNYTGDGGMLLLQTELGDDSSASDKLVISDGSASGSTSISVINVGGAGASTVQDGIIVVEAVNGATTESGAFALNGPVAAGAFEFPVPGRRDRRDGRELVPAVDAGGSSPAGAGTGTSSCTADASDRGPTLPIPVSPPPAPTPGNPNPVPPPPVQPAPPTPGATPVIAEVIPLYHIEVPTYSVVPPIAHHLALSTLGTFHERRGEQALLHGAGYLPTWARIFGQDAEMKWDGTVSPSFDGTLFGFQAGQDLFGWESGNDHHDRVGLFVGHARMDGDVKGQALGWNDLLVGQIDLDGTSVGGYWTHIGPNGWYLDGVVMGTWFGGDATSDRAVGVDIDGTGIMASLEGGYPIALTPEWTIEPQAQLIWQHLSFDDQTDRFSTVSFDSEDGVTGRLGFRLQGNFQTEAATFQPYLKANLWHNFDGEDRITFETPIITEIGGTALELGGGVIAKLSESTSLFATADYTFDVDGEKTRIFEGNIGVSVKW